jgi:Protein of unknown function (DUF3078)
MRKFLVFIGVFLVFMASAQDVVVNKLRSETSRTIKKEADSTKWAWKRGGLFLFSLSQGSLSNWAAGGDNFSLAANTYLNYYIFHQKGRKVWDNNMDLNLGYVNTSSSGGRKNDDRMDFLSKFGYKMDTTGKWFLSGLFNFRSQFFDGFNYGTNPAELSSSFMAPGYFIFSLGFDYKPSSKLSVFMSPLTSRYTVVTKKELYEKGLYGVPKGQKSLNEIGAFVTVNFSTTVAKNIAYKGRMDLFSNYKLDPQNVDLFMTNQFAFKINKYFSATYSLDLIYDDNVRLFGQNNTSPALQTKSLIGIGFLKPLNVIRK